MPFRNINTNWPSRSVIPNSATSTEVRYALKKHFEHPRVQKVAMPTVEPFYPLVPVANHVSLVRHDREMAKRKIGDHVTCSYTHAITKRLKVKVASLLTPHRALDVLYPFRNLVLVQRTDHNGREYEPVGRLGR